MVNLLNVALECDAPPNQNTDFYSLHPLLIIIKYKRCRVFPCIGILCNNPLITFTIITINLHHWPVMEYEYYAVMPASYSLLSFSSFLVPTNNQITRCLGYRNQIYQIHKLVVTESVFLMK